LDVTPTSGSTPGTITVSVNVGQLVPGPQSGTITVRLENSSASTFNIPVTLSVAGSAIQIREVLNAATLSPTVLSPGEIVTLTGTGIGPAVPRVAQPSAGGAFGTELAGVRVLFDGIPAPLLLVQEAQINAIAPYALQGRSTARVQVQVDSSYSIPIQVKVADAAPGIFTSGIGGKGQAAALNADFSGNSVLNPALRGGVIIVYLTGEGQTDPAGQDGRVINSDLRRPLLPVTALIGGKSAEVLYAGSGPMLVSGLCQVNIQIPEGLAPGTQPLEIQVGGIPTQRGVTIAVY
jgi:uncharacterized protein (TIGR03437 family)